ncbi:CPBP family intramembrane glutamic endopeptidase [Allorhizocola rhizosphaerae]|uniref:CPBP family intramembrane glutamic endopeptidase n=1 Tax=Allorhizocola rhizosphaerae TaxID=1872709 RepID=UPI001B8C1A74|nr:type II CAAX endopeptidase family protein [Allorhizocola rhizosphaerae]
MGLKSKGVLTFLLISFGLAWVAIFVAYFVLGMSMADPRTQLTVALPMAFSPAIAAVVVRRWVTKEGFGDAGFAPRVRTAGFYYLLAWTGPMLVFGAIVGLSTLARPYDPDLSSLWQPIVLLLLVSPIVLLPMYWGEEFGWRGHLQQRVSRHPVRAALITGIIWAAWHYPLAFTDYVHYDNLLLGLLTWTLTIVLQAIILAWLFYRSRTVWVPCLAHAGNNMIIGTLSSTVLIEAGGLDSATVEALGLIPLAAICAWILLTRRLSAREPVMDKPMAG